jgi:ATP-dependent RNA helicase RhlE
LYFMLQFSDFNLTKPMLQALELMGLHTPTTIQEKAFPVIMSGRDVCGIAQTGTGKTLAYLLPTIRLIEYAKHRFPQMLILVPTRELVTQVVGMAQQLCQQRSLTVVGVYGGVNMKPQAAAIINGVDILVATPGRVYDLILNGALNTKAIKKLVIDEVDEMLNLGFRTQLRNIMDVLPERRQNLMFSATLGDEVEQLLDVYFNDPVRVEAAPAGSPLSNINQMVYEVPNFYTKVNLLTHLLESDSTMNKVLLFTASKRMADQLFEALLPQYETTMGVIHSNKEQNHRFKTVNALKDGTYRFVIATDIVARGIDIAGVTHVINFDLPEIAEHYIHRIGRTGRADQKGEAISFMIPQEVERRTSIEQLMQMKIPESTLPDAVIISTELTEDEMPKVFHKEVQIKQVKRENVGAAFHEKSAKNSRFTQKVSHKDKMMQKYGKPKTRGAKVKKRK